MGLEIVVYDASPVIQKIFSHILYPYGPKVHRIDQPEQLMEATKKQKPDIIFIDPSTSEQTLQNFAPIKNELNAIPLILMSNTPLKENKWQGVKTKAFLKKPIEAQRLNQLIRHFVPKTKTNIIGEHLHFPALSELGQKAAGGGTQKNTPAAPPAESPPSSEREGEGNLTDLLSPSLTPDPSLEEDSSTDSIVVEDVSEAPQKKEVASIDPISEQDLEEQTIRTSLSPDHPLTPSDETQNSVSSVALEEGSSSPKVQLRVPSSSEDSPPSPPAEKKVEKQPASQAKESAPGASSPPPPVFSVASLDEKKSAGSRQKEDALSSPSTGPGDKKSTSLKTEDSPDPLNPASETQNTSVLSTQTLYSSREKTDPSTPPTRFFNEKTSPPSGPGEKPSSDSIHIQPLQPKTRPPKKQALDFKDLLTEENLSQEMQNQIQKFFKTPGQKLLKDLIEKEIRPQILEMAHTLIQKELDQLLKEEEPQ